MTYDAMTYLVTGATGNIGRKVVDHLIARGATDIRALSAKPDKANLPDGVQVHQGFIGDLDSLEGLFDGVQRMYLAPYEETAAQVCQRAADAGVQHIVDVSGPPDNWWYGVAEAVQASAPSWTHLWPGEFIENTAVWADQIRGSLLQGRAVVKDAFGDSANAPVCMDDIAEVAAAIMVSGTSGEGGARCEGSVAPEFDRTELYLAGPQLLTKREKVAAIAAGLEIDIDFVQISREEAITMLQPSMGEYAQWYVGLSAQTHEPEQSWVQVVPTVTGRPATNTAQWVAANRHEFR